MGYERVIELVKSAKKIVDNELLKKDIHMKGAANFVTAVDTEISRYLKERLKEYYPEVGFFSEEEEGSLSDPCWILDPIDGTTNLVYGYNMSTVSLALYQGGRIQFGVVFNPFNGECFTAELGRGAYLDGHRIHVSQREMAESIIEFGAGSTHKENAEANFEIAKECLSNALISGVFVLPHCLYAILRPAGLTAILRKYLSLGITLRAL